MAEKTSSGEKVDINSPEMLATTEILANIQEALTNLESKYPQTDLSRVASMLSNRLGTLFSNPEKLEEYMRQ